MLPLEQPFIEERLCHCCHASSADASRAAGVFSLCDALFDSLQLCKEACLLFLILVLAMCECSGALCLLFVSGGTLLALQTQ